MRETFKSLPKDPTELRAVSKLMAAEIKSQAYQIEKLKKELAGHRKARFGSKSETMDQLAFDRSTNVLFDSRMFKETAHISMIVT